MASSTGEKIILVTFVNGCGHHVSDIVLTRDNEFGVIPTCGRARAPTPLLNRVIIEGAIIEILNN